MRNRGENFSQPFAVICGAKKKSTGEPCKKAPMKGRTRCRVHGGKTPRGIAASRFKTGIHSGELPTNLPKQYAEAYLESMENPNQIELRRELAVVDSLISDLLARLGSGESHAHLKRLREANNALRKAQRQGDPSLTDAATRELQGAVDSAYNLVESYAELGSQIDRRGRLAEIERKRIKEAQDSITAQQAMVLVTALFSTARKHIREPKALEAFRTDIMGILNRDSGNLALPPSDGD